MARRQERPPEQAGNAALSVAPSGGVVVSVAQERGPPVWGAAILAAVATSCARYRCGHAHEEVHPHPVCVGKRRGTAALLHRASVVLYATTSYFIIGLDLVFQRF